MKELATTVMKNYVASYMDLPKNCWQGISLTFINAISLGICFFLSLYFVNILHFNITVTGILISSYGLGTITGGLLSGKLSDKISPKIISTFSLIIQAFAFLMLIKLKSINLLIINLFMLGMATYGFKTSNNVWTLEQCKGQSKLRLKTINISHAASNLGLGLSGVIIGSLASYGFERIFYLSSTLLFLSAIYMLYNKAEPLTELSIKKSHIEKNILIERKNKKIILLILGCLFLIGLIIAQLGTTYPIYVEEAFPQLGIKAVSILFILDTVLIVLFQAPLINLLENHNKIIIVGLGALLMGIGMLVLSFSFIFALSLLSCVIWTTGEMLFMPIAQLVCYEKGAEKKKGQALGVFQGTFAMSSIIGPIIGSLIYQYFGGNTIWYLSAAIGILCFIICYHFKKFN